MQSAPTENGETAGGASPSPTTEPGASTVDEVCDLKRNGGRMISSPTVKRQTGRHFPASLREGGGPRSGGRSKQAQKQSMLHCPGQMPVCLVYGLLNPLSLHCMSSSSVAYGRRGSRKCGNELANAPISTLPSCDSPNGQRGGCKRNSPISRYRQCKIHTSAAAGG